MKRIATLTVAVLILTILAGCGSRPGAAPAETLQPLQTIDTGTVEPTQPADTAPDQTDDLSSGGDDQEAPDLTPWPEPASIAYNGNYLDVAQDRDASKYPALSVNKQAQVTLLEMPISFEIPSSWSISDPDGTPTFIDDKGRAVGQIYQIDSYQSDPYYSMLPDGGTPIAWEAPGPYKYDARALTLESATPTATDDQKKTIIKIVGILSDVAYTDENGVEYYQAYCLSFDKAYVNGSTPDYVISNTTIDEIAKSFANGLNLDDQ